MGSVQIPLPQPPGIRMKTTQESFLSTHVKRSLHLRYPCGSPRLPALPDSSLLPVIRQSPERVRRGNRIAVILSPDTIREKNPIGFLTVFGSRSFVPITSGLRMTRSRVLLSSWHHSKCFLQVRTRRTEDFRMGKSPAKFTD